MHNYVIIIKKYFEDVKYLKKTFIDRCYKLGMKNIYESFKCWSYFMFLYLNNIDNEILHLIPCINDSDICNNLANDIISYLCEKNIEYNNALVFVINIIDNIKYLFDKYNNVLHIIYEDDTIKEYIGSHITKTDMTNINKTIIIKLTYYTSFVKFNINQYNNLMENSKNISAKLKMYNMFTLGFNYFILDCNSFHWAIPKDIIEEHVTIEGYSSPLNHISKRYCSLFAIDKEFGAICNFNNYMKNINNLSEGIIEINPPFINDIMIKSAKLIINILDKLEYECRKQQYLFMYIIPEWTDCDTYKLLINSKYLCNDIVLSKKTYCYQYNNKNINVNFTTHILLLSYGNGKMLITPKLLDDIYQKFIKKPSYLQDSNKIL